MLDYWYYLFFFKVIICAIPLEIILIFANSPFFFRIQVYINLIESIPVIQFCSWRRLLRTRVIFNPSLTQSVKPPTLIAFLLFNKVKGTTIPTILFNIKTNSPFLLIINIHINWVLLVPIIKFSLFRRHIILDVVLYPLIAPSIKKPTWFILNLFLFEKLGIFI